MNTTQKKKAAVNKLMRQRGLSRTAAEAQVDTTGLDAVIIALGGVSTSDCGTSYSNSDSGGGGGYSSSDGGSSCGGGGGGGE